jgi:hypothetical protein
MNNYEKNGFQPNTASKGLSLYAYIKGGKVAYVE